MTLHNPIGLVGKDASSNAVPMTTTTDSRHSLAAWLSKDTNGKAIPGILPSSPNAQMTVKGTSGFSYAVDPGGVAIVPDASSGAYVIGSDGTVTVNTAAAPGSGSRIDIIYVQVQDAWDRTASSSAVILGCLSGASTTGTPAAPALPDAAIELARNTMVSTATSTSSTGNSITQSSPFAALAGGLQKFRAESDRIAATTAGNRAVGGLSWTMATKRISVYDGGSEQLFGSPISVLSQADRDSRFPPPAAISDQIALQNMRPRVWRQDLGIEEAYYAAYDATNNPWGAAASGWQPVGARNFTYQVHRGDTVSEGSDNGSGGSFINVIAGTSGPAPAGTYGIGWTFVGRNANGTIIAGNLRAIASSSTGGGGAIVSQDQECDLGPQVLPYSGMSLYAHTGGTLSLSLNFQVAGGQTFTVLTAGTMMSAVLN